MHAYLTVLCHCKWLFLPPPPPPRHPRQNNVMTFFFFLVLFCLSACSAGGGGGGLSAQNVSAPLRNPSPPPLPVPPRWTNPCYATGKKEKSYPLGNLGKGGGGNVLKIQNELKIGVVLHHNFPRYN